MPELPEVETVRRGLSPVMVGARFEKVEARRRDLRFPLPKGFAARVAGARVDRLDRRGKYLIAALSTGESLVMHLGMSGRFTVTNGIKSATGAYYYADEADPRHDHVVFEMAGGSAPARIVYNDPRRFGFMDLIESTALHRSAHFRDLGPEPLSAAFDAASFNAALERRGAPIKAALIDQSLVVGVGNIYACEALFRAGVSPKRAAMSVAGARGRRLHAALCEVLEEAIAAGGSSLRDFAASDGALGYFQNRFNVYDREDKPCPKCATPVRRIVQSGRSTFYCRVCQR
ncbi:MAG: bifunctional DNA-formamidopyrimidine glycosylase/DNA-(apurinic or apyrimidinic site) lyase [Parvularculaceae bacterium]